MLYNEAEYNEQPYQFFALNEVVTITDVVSKNTTKVLSETTFFSDSLTRQITNKIISENLTFLDWISWKQQSSQWFD